MTIKNIQIVSDEVKLHGILSIPDKSIGVGLIFFHGGGHSNAERYAAVQDFFSKHGVTCLAFSFRGCGKSGGLLTNSTLLDRLVDAESALRAFKLATGLTDNKIFLWGSSMGGHVVSRLTANHSEIKGVIFQSAAAYGQFAETQPFGPKFSDSINKENNWIDSLAFSDLVNYQNQTLILYGKEDNVIPESVKQKYILSSNNPQFHIIEGYGHPMLRPTTDIEKAAWNKMVNLGLNFISSK